MSKPLPHSDSEKALLTDVCLLLGRIMFQNGATVQRIIDSMDCLREHFGGSQIHILVAYDAIVITDIEGDRFYTKIDQSRDFAGTNIEGLTTIRQLLRDLPRTRPSITEVKLRLTEINERKSNLGGVAGHAVFGLTGVLFGVLNNADLWAVCSVFPACTLIGWFRTVLLQRKYNFFVSTLVATLAGIILSCLLLKLSPTVTPLVAVIAPVLTMIPGFPLVNGGIDILRNHNSVGLARIAFAAMLISTLTLAISGPLVLFFGTLHSPPPLSHGNAYLIARDCVAGSSAAILLGLLFNAPRNYLWMFGFGGAVTLLIRTCCFVFLGADPATSTFFAAVGITVTAFLVSRRGLLPPVLFAVVCVLAMTPGYLMVSGLNDCFALSKIAVQEIPNHLVTSTLHTLLRAGLIVFAMIAGVVFPILILEGRKPRV